MIKNYIENVKKQFQHYKTLGEKTFEQLPPKKLFWQYNEANNSIAIIVKHLSGNMISRWTDFFNSDGEKVYRNRDTEFKNDIKSKEEILYRWQKGWNCLFNALDSINESNFGNTIYIRNQSHSVTDAINRQLAHYSYHVGQIVMLGKMISGKNWKSLSIPIGKSEDYNKEMFSKK